MSKKRTEVLIVDGYNVINAWEELQELSRTDLEQSRDKLNFMLSEYVSYQGIQGYIIYDAYNVKTSNAREETIGRLTVIYTKEKQTADTYIEKLITTFPFKRHTILRVVTDDMAEQQLILGVGGVRLSTRELYLEIKESAMKIRRKTQETPFSRNTLDEILNPDTLQKLNTLRKQ